MRDKVLYRLIGEQAALAGIGQAVSGLNGGSRQNDIDAFAHARFGIDAVHTIGKPCVYIGEWRSNARSGAGPEGHTLIPLGFTHDECAERANLKPGSW